MNLITFRLAIVLILGGLATGLFLKYMVWRIQNLGVDEISALAGLIAMGILVITGLAFHHKYCPVQKTG